MLTFQEEKPHSKIQERSIRRKQQQHSKPSNKSQEKDVF